ncbi:MAG: MBL fold metallo-hydrolase [Peptostreptococcaceae bacterium]|nr:MBL fold metallo-hydrolase [Peptostreptococcaceae bacterium]MDY5738966.1 MBL fold metallo-hydrolase [Anaerovoracaceae bacterium]
MKIKFCGATGGVTGSCHLLTTLNHKILLDCGQFQGGKAQDALNYEPFQFEPSEVECVILSHAHIDHCGRLPLLMKRGFTGPIYCTSATADLLEVMLRDSGYIHEKEAEWKNKKADRTGRAKVEPLYTLKDAEKCLLQVKPILYDQLVELTPNVKIVFNDAGHILGSAITEIWVKEEDKEAKIVFSGDLGMTERPILRDPTIIKKADYVIMEATYGSRNHPKNSASIENLLKIVLETTKRGGNVIIPSFAVGRTQELIFEFNKFYEEHPEVKSQLDKIMVYVDSPMATTATEVFRKNAQVFDDETKNYILKGDNPLDFQNLRFTRSTAESQSLNMDKSPKVIISASGMCEAGRIRHHLKHNLWDSRNSIVFVGYQGEGTLGRMLVEGAKEVTLFGEVIAVNAEIHNLEGFSGHADQNGLFSWVAGFQQKPSKVFIVHGETESKETFAKLIKEKLELDPIVLTGVAEYDLDTYDVKNFEEAQLEAATDAEIQNLRQTISTIHSDLEKILYNTDLAMGNNLKADKLVRINNLAQELKKTTLNLGSVVTELDKGEKKETNAQ